jgi:tetratricopeptide (TPR) repeat protein
MPSSNESTFTISVADLDTSLLPKHAQVPNTDAFRNAVTDLIRSEYRQLGGRARVVIDDKAGTIQVTWRPGAGQPDPLEVAVAKLKSGNYQEAVRILEILRFQQPERAAVFYNLGMALSDMGRLALAVQHLRTVLAIEPDHTNSLVGLGVALARQQKSVEAIQTFRQALDQEPDNPWAHRNLGACLLKQEGKAEEAERHLRRAVELLPVDQQALYGLGQALLALGREKDADEQFIKVIEQDDRTPIAELAKEERSKLAGSSFRTAGGGGGRFDAVMYCVAALERFAQMSRQEVQKVGFEIAILGQSGLDTNDSKQKYTLRSLPGNFSGLHLVSLMYVAFKIIAPDHDVGFDLSKEYQAALALHQKR